MGPANLCPSEQLGFCKVGEKCYAKKAERLYRNVLPYRIRQRNYWRTSSAPTIAAHFNMILQRIRVKIQYLRFNESGDFFAQEDVQKLSLVAEFLKKEHGIITYGYSSRQDLDFENIHFLVKGSSCGNGNNGRTVVIKKHMIRDHLSTLSTDERKTWKVCPMSCKKCNLCKKKTGINIIFPLH